jgi:hypothetical protein
VISLAKLSELDTAASTRRGGEACRIWLAAQPADMRCGFDRLAELASLMTGGDPLGGHLFLFRSRGGDRLKILYRDTDGYAFEERGKPLTIEQSTTLRKIESVPFFPLSRTSSTAGAINCSPNARWTCLLALSSSPLAIERIHRDGCECRLAHLRPAPARLAPVGRDMGWLIWSAA